MLIVGAAATLAVVLAVAAAGKLWTGGFAEFERSVGRLWPGRSRLTTPVRRRLAIAIVTAEILFAVALLAGVALPVLSPERAGWSGAGFAGAGLLMAAFTVGQAAALRRGQAVVCACFGRSATPVGPLSLARNALLLLLSLAGLVLAAVGVAEVVPASASGAAVAGLALALLLVNLEEMVQLFGPQSTPNRFGGR